ncbi:transcription factor IIIB 50 kDa subunit [Pelobates cultripes]|uniref:Transcription factor IIIB 50 kDa subunit n=1 Tax=Pelobates cultripes TaxID=61616 RepID=A0AAD1RNU1_PELCU|nr:transcription factor IIIB 50 kDa subunit [Pelobates cultripes]
MSGPRQCPDCGSCDVVEDAHYSQDQLVCTACGFILTEGLLTTTQAEEGFQQAVKFSESTGERESTSKCKLRGIKRVRDVCRVLRLPDSFTDTAVSYYEQAFNHPTYHFITTQKKEAVMGCCVYITCRQHQWPLTMATICSLLYTKKEIFASIYPDVVQTLKLNVPLLSLCDLVKSHCTSFKLFQNSSSVPPAYVEDLNKVLERALQTVELASETWLVTGRHPIPIVTAAAYVSWQSLQPSTRLSCTFVRFCKLSDVDLPPPSKKRLKEFHEIFLKLANQLPWLKMLSLNKNTVVRHLGDILKHRSYLLRQALAATETVKMSTDSETYSTTGKASQSSPFLPPCITNPQKRSYRMAFPPGPQNLTGEEDISDSEIEQYLRTPSEIEEFKHALAQVPSV